jgi:hypothetical protein
MAKPKVFVSYDHSEDVHYSVCCRRGTQIQTLILSSTAEDRTCQSIARMQRPSNSRLRE